MPRGHRARAADEPEMMDIEEPAAQLEPSTQPEAEDESDEKEYEETITLSAKDIHALQDTLEDIRFQISNIQRDARQDRLDSQAMLQDILSRLPPAPGASSAPPQ